MKITFILPGFTRFPVGGYQIVYQYAGYLSSQGYDVEIIHAMFLPTQDKPTIKKRIIYSIKSLLFTMHLIRPWFQIDPRIKVLNKGKIRVKDIRNADRVIATAWETSEFVSLLPSECGKKYYFIQHYETWGGKERVDKTWRLPLKKIVIASWLKQIASKMQEPAALVPNFVDQTNFFVTKPINERTATISMLYSEHIIKGSNLGIQALQMLKDKYPHVQIKLFGVFDEPDDLPEGTIYYQNPSRKVLRDEIYNESSVYLFPSISEGWGLTATEAMACGAALCSTDNGGVDDFAVDGESALISPINNVELLYKNLERLINDDELRNRIAMNGQQNVLKLTFDSSAHLFENAIDLA
ncbi:polysaccharide biosynthesis protein [Lactiplantibacillus pentosus]|uniref:glycosyltransferase family 4 protein n=1 Tax=Lactiplantibacillus pentosus TaxID=1589 RepID=UPI000D01D1A1|nr:glycosyltransferase family 4 protein [Lactiplantibacillus pentosus]PRO86206.1 polysaccharide biosynthesis protein [Lactiplantibacillus pentosus]